MAPVKLEINLGGKIFVVLCSTLGLQIHDHILVVREFFFAAIKLWKVQVRDVWAVPFSSGFSSHPMWNQFAPMTSIGYLNPTKRTSSGRRCATAVPPVPLVHALTVLLVPALMVVQSGE